VVPKRVVGGPVKAEETQKKMKRRWSPKKEANGALI
jgi:hypothetical protein